MTNKELAALLVEHAGARVVPMISSECWNENFHWTAGTITKVEIDEIWEWDERLYMLSKDKEELELDLSEQAINLLAIEGIPYKDNDNYEKTLNQLKSKVIWQKAIILYVE